MYHCFRLTRGQDLYRAIEDYAKDHHIAAGAVVSGVGCVSRWEVRDASGVTVQSGTEDVEIVSLTGTITTMDGQYYAHLHMSCGDEQGHVFGGHLNRAVVSATCEMVVTEIDGSVDRAFSPEVGLNLFKF